MQFSAIFISLLSFSAVSTLAAPVANAQPVAVAAAGEQLEARTYISYGALGRDGVGRSNGRTSQANPPSRPCTKENRCARDPGA